VEDRVRRERGDEPVGAVVGPPVRVGDGHDAQEPVRGDGQRGALSGQARANRCRRALHRITMARRRPRRNCSARTLGTTFHFMQDDRITGKTMRWTFDDGPMAGKTFEHVFAPSGTVTFSQLDGKANPQPSREHRYRAARVSEEVSLVSYLGTSGYALTVALNFATHKLVAVASNEKELVLQHGSFT
jgi:hypothetical protein